MYTRYAHLNSYRVKRGEMVPESLQGYQYPITNEALDATIRLVADIAKRNGMTELYKDGGNGTLTWHNDFSQKACPGDYVMAMTPYIMQSANEIMRTGTYTPDPKVLPEIKRAAAPTTLQSLDPSSITSGTVASDLYLVSNAMNSINESIANNEALQGRSVTTESTASIPAGLYETQKSVLGITAGVVNNLSQETSLIMNMADVIYQMDQDMANRASDLSDGSNLLKAYSSQVNEELNKVINSNITSGLSIKESLFSPGTHAEGTVGKISINDIRSMYSGGQLTGALKENIDSEISDAKNTKSQISTFQSTIRSSKNLQGEMWNKVSQKLDKYADLMDLRVDSMEKLETAYEKALKLISDYMEGYDELDDSKLPELRDALQQLQQAIEEAKHVMTATHEETRTGGSGNNTYTYTVTVYDYSAGARAEAQAYIEQATQQCTEISAEITKLEGLPDIISQAEQIVNDALCEIYGSYGTKASEIVTGSASSYIPPANTSYTSPRLSESEFKKDSQLVSDYGTYENYKNYKKISTYSSPIEKTLKKILD